jgi:acetyl-CoA acyltransferase
MTDIVIASYRRSPFHFANKGELARVRPDDLAAVVLRALVAESGLDAEGIEDLIVGCAFPEGEQGLNVARLIGFIAGLPRGAGGVTVNRFCGSSMQAIHQAAGAIALGAGEAFLCAGVESMSRVPMGGFNPLPNPVLAQEYPQAYIAMGETAENVASRYQVSRADQEAFAVESHRRAAAARAEGKLREEIVPVGNAAEDGCIRPDTSAEKLATLKPAFRADGTVTAGTSSPLTDGAAAVLVCTPGYAKANRLQPLARVKSIAVAGCLPELMGIGPVGATRKALARAGIATADLDVIEINEAFASQAIACMRELGLDPARTNIDGGGIAIGHPLGATGARITGKAASLLRREGGRYALATQCIGGGQGIATVLEAVQ